MKNIKLILLTVVILLSFKQLNATALAPTSYGSYYSGIKLTGKQIVFSGAGSYDNDAQANGYTPRWEWDFQYNGSSFVVRANTTSSLANWTYTTKGTYTVAVRYWDNDNQCGNVYTFTIKIAELETLYYVKDHLGNIRVTVDNAATIKGYDDYDPYGLQLDGRSMNNANDNAKYKYSSKELDKENGFNCYYFGARYYDPAIGRWLAVDPLADKYPGWSSYNYCLNNPIRSVDPDGKIVIPVNGSSDKFKENYNMVVDYLTANSALGPLGEIINSPEIVYVQEGKINSFEDANGKRIMTWNPNMGFISDNGSMVSPAVTLVHEADHANQNISNPKQQKKDGNTSDKQYKNKEEKRVITGSEQKTARALKEIKKNQVTRTNHRSSPYPTISPISNETKLKITPKKEDEDKK